MASRGEKDKRVSRLTHAGSLQGTNGTYVEVVVRRFALDVGSHCDGGFGGVSRGFESYGKSVVDASK